MQPNRTQTDARTRPQRRIPGAYLVHVCVRTDTADVLRRPAGERFLSVQTQMDEKRPFASPRWRCPYAEGSPRRTYLLSRAMWTISVDPVLGVYEPMTLLAG
jgi:hypothetical protein